MRRFSVSSKQYSVNSKQFRGGRASADSGGNLTQSREGAKEERDKENLATWPLSVRHLFSTQSLAWMILLAMAVLALAGCSKVTPAPAPTPTSMVPRFDDDEAAIHWLLEAESRGVVNKDMALLTAIWADDGTVTDAKHTPDDSADDARWQGIDAVMDRYVTLVFPGNPTVAAPADVQIAIDGDTAEAVSTTHINDERSPGGDRWTFVKRNGRWYIHSLTYNLEEKAGP